MQIEIQVDSFNLGYDDYKHKRGFNLPIDDKDKDAYVAGWYEAEAKFGGGKR